MKSNLILAVVLFAFGASYQVARAETALKHEALFDLALDIDKDGKMDHAVLVLVGPGQNGFYGTDNDIYSLGENEHVDLYIYLGAGDAALDISKPPSVLKEYIIDAARTPWVNKLTSNGKGSLQIQSSYGAGASNDYDDTITIVDRDGKFLVAGYREDWDTRNSIGSCDFNLLSGQATKQLGLDANGAPKKPLKGKFKPVALADWSEKTRPKACGN